MSEPTRGQQRCMIYAPAGRKLEDGCEHCGLSITFCHANTALNRRHCCPECSH